MHPFSLLPIALASGRGRVDGLESAALVAAGFTLLQRCAPLVRALAGRPSAIILPPSAQFVTALAASEGRPALLLDPRLTADQLAAALDVHDVGALFTTGTAMDQRLGRWPAVSFDDSLVSAHVRLPDGRALEIDLGSHFGLTLEGETEVVGSDEPCLIIPGLDTSARQLSHRVVLDLARSVLKAEPLAAGATVRAAPSWSDLGSLIETGIAPLLAGADISTKR